MSRIKRIALLLALMSVLLITSLSKPTLAAMRCAFCSGPTSQGCICDASCGDYCVPGTVTTCAKCMLL